MTTSSPTTTVLDRYAGHDRYHRAAATLLYRAREIRSLIHKAGSTVVPQHKQSRAVPAPRLAGNRILVVDADEAVRRSAHHLLGCQGASVETARDAHEAIALMRQAPYSAALVDIRLPDLDGYESFKRLREVQPNVPVILMTGFGWDPSHSIVKARQEGLQTVLLIPGGSFDGCRRTSPRTTPAPWQTWPTRMVHSPVQPCLSRHPRRQTLPLAFPTQALPLSSHRQSLLTHNRSGIQSWS